MTTTTAHSRGATPLTDEQIDATLAVRVMQWGASSANGVLCWNVPSNGGYFRAIPQTSWRPSTSIAQAWQVLEKFPWQDWHVTLGLEKDGWGCNISGKIYAMGVGDTAPRAICLAALKAVGIKINISGGE